PGPNNPLSSPLCGVTIDAHDSASHILYYNFDGVTPCFSPSRTRAGQIKVQLTSGSHWGDVGAVLTLTYNSFKVTRLSDNKSIMFNGTKTLKNINGNNWIGFLLGTTTLKSNPIISIYIFKGFGSIKHNGTKTLKNINGN